MRLLPLLLPLLALLPTSLCAPKETKLQRITALAKSSKGPIVLTDKTFEDITAGPRNYTSLVLLTALENKFGCHLCREFQPEFELMANSWLRKHRDSNAFFFSYLDFSKGMVTFKKLGLASAPVLFLYQPTYGPNAKGDGKDPLRFEFVPVESQADHLSDFISQNTPYTVKIERPIDYFKPALTITLSLFTLIASRFLLPFLLPLIQHPTLWAAFSLITILLFTSGHMFNHIRKTPYLQHGKGGQVSYIAGGFSNQFAVESQIIGVVYAFLAFGTIALAMKVPRIKEVRRQNLAVVVWSGVVLCLFSFLMGVFKVKNPAYPFWLPPMMGRI